METNLDKYSKLPTQLNTPVIIEAHINGGRTKEMNPNVPVGYNEVAEDAIACLDAGACAIHAHNSNFMLKGEEAYIDYMKSWNLVLKKHPNALWYGTTCAPMVLSEEECGLEHVELLAKHAGVKLACLDPGLDNLPVVADENGYLTGFTYGYPLEKINKQVELCNKNDIGIVWGIYEPGYLRTALHFIKQRMSPKGSSLDYYLIGEYGLAATTPINTAGVPATIESLYFYRYMSEECNLPWYVSIWGGGDSENTRLLLKRAIELGGHIKVGLELHYDPVKKPTNVELIQEVQEIAKEVGRPIATAKESRKILGLD